MPWKTLPNVKNMKLAVLLASPGTAATVVTGQLAEI
jgi:hypothetical protein